MAESPELIKATVVLEDHKFGKYIVRFYDRGMQKDVVIDNLMPTSNCFDRGFQAPVFAHTVTAGEIYPFLIEKAWAKLHGSYC